ncbi:MAG: taurine dioxygenase [Gammaproteobacteria bacterium]|jgi:taurine dioxygenase|nr:taurine dioxygenase [Gammaproteobacteria bacterium]MBT5204981.1 taurine dioxygenase [Gammaproteobacteria bacterium]MBT5602617.1 taurine dioxygenase [Gammaproteobacteria bacterium]MBT6244215.1 taurine dioxygenase [Gammaproteobacteria bacterium]
MNALIAPRHWTVKRLSGSLGAEVSGFNIADLSEQEISNIKALLIQHQVLFFPGQHPSNQEHVSFGERFGPLEGHPNLKSEADTHPKIFKLIASHGGIADEWHTDITFQERPAVMSVLHMVTCPEIGGDTMWTNLYQAYNELSEPMKELCLGLTALHDAHPHNRPEQMAIHPVVRLHPETERPALYVNEHFTRRIVELSATESEVLLGYLTKWVSSPRFTIRYQWDAGTVCMWDNRCTQHFVINDFQGERIIERVTVMGDQVEAARASPWQPYVRSGPLSAKSRHDRQLFNFLTKSS